MRSKETFYVVAWEDMEGSCEEIKNEPPRERSSFVKSYFAKDENKIILCVEGGRKNITDEFGIPGASIELY